MANGGNKARASAWDKGAFFVSILSLVIAAIAGFFSLQAQEEATTVNLTAAASTNVLGSTPAGYAVQISFINESLRPVIIRSMALTVDKTPVAGIRNFLVDNRAGTDAASLGDEPLEASRPLPVALAARGALTMTGLANFYEPLPLPAGGKAERHEKALEFCRQVEGHSGRSDPSVRLEVNVDPGETLVIPVRITGPVGGGNTWSLAVEGPTSGPTGVEFRRRISAPSALRLLTVKVWRQHGGMVRSRSLPVVGAGSAEVTFPRLHRGNYRTALMDRGKVLASGRFRVPLEFRDDIVYPSEAQLRNGECLRLKGGRDIFFEPRTKYEHPK